MKKQETFNQKTFKGQLRNGSKENIYFNNQKKSSQVELNRPIRGGGSSSPSNQNKQFDEFNFTRKSKYERIPYQEIKKISYNKNQQNSQQNFDSKAKFPHSNLPIIRKDKDQSPSKNYFCKKLTTENVQKIVNKARSQSPLARCSPQQKIQFKNIKFLNTIQKPENQDQNDEQYQLKVIFTSSKKRQLFPQPQEEPVKLTENELKIKNKMDYMKNFKQIERSIERNRIYSVQDTKIQKFQYSELIQQKLPRQVGILEPKKKDDHSPDQCLAIPNQKFGDNYAYIVSGAVEQINDLKVLDLNNNRLTDEGIYEIIKKLSKSTQDIDLSNNQLGIINFRNFISIIGSDYKIKILKLENCGLKDVHIEELQKCFQTSPHLSILDLSKNQISKYSKNSLKSLIQGCINLQELYLNWNIINSEGGFYIFQGLNQKLTQDGKLRVLDLSQNSIGAEQSKFWSLKVMQELIKFLNNCTEYNLLHVDISHNKFNIASAQQIQKQLKLNQSIVGFHFSSQNWYINSRGFLKQIKEENQEIQITPTNIQKKIDSCRFQGYNQARIKQIQSQVQILDFKTGDNCWICEGWIEHKFNWLKSSGEIKGQKLYIHLEIDEFKPCQLLDLPKQGCFYINRMVPPRCNIKYYFSTDGFQKVILAQDHKTTDLKQQIRGYFKKIKKQEPPQHKYQLSQDSLDNQIFIQRQQEEEYEKQTFELQNQAPVFKTMNILQTGNHVQIIDNNYKVQFSQIPRQDYSGNMKNKNNKDSQWNWQNSIFKEYKLEDQQFLKKCFDFDWECSKIGAFIKNEEVHTKVKEILFDMYSYIKNAYRHLSYISLTGETPGLSLPVFLDFVKNCGSIIDGKSLKIEDVEQKFNSVNQSSKFKKNQRNPDKALIRYQFIEVIIKIAEDKYLRNQTHRRLDEALVSLFDDGYFYGLKHIQQSQEWREQYYWNMDCELIIKNNLHIVKHVYKKYAGSLKKKVFQVTKFLSVEEFKEIMVQCKVVIKDNIKIEEINQAFGNSMMTQVDEINTDKFLQMQQIEFIEAIARVAEFTITCKYKSPQMAQLMSDLDKEKQNKIKLEKQLAKKKLENNSDYDSVDQNDSDQQINISETEKKPQEQFASAQNIRLKLHHKIEMMFFLFYNFVCSDDFKDANPFPPNTIFKND